MNTIGIINDRCDATLRVGKIYVIDPEKADDPVVLHLGRAAKNRLDNGRLLPREWLRIATIIGPSHRLVAEEVYSRFGLCHRCSLARLSMPLLRPSLSFPRPVEIRTNAHVAASVAISWEGSDLYKENNDTPLASIIEEIGYSAFYSSLDEYVYRDRQAMEIQDIINIIVNKHVPNPSREWIQERWAYRPEMYLSSLVDLSLKVLDWTQVLSHALDTIDRVAPARRYLEAAAWRRITRAAPLSETRSIQESLLSRIDVESIEEHKRPRFMRTLGVENAF